MTKIYKRKKAITESDGAVFVSLTLKSDRRIIGGRRLRFVYLGFDSMRIFVGELYDIVQLILGGWIALGEVYCPSLNLLLTQ